MAKFKKVFLKPLLWVCYKAVSLKAQDWAERKND